jgi:hypothetical protein
MNGIFYFSGPGRSGHYRRLCLRALVSIAVRGSVSAVKAKTPRVPRPVLDVLLAVYRASAGKTHSRYYVSVDRLALPLNRQRATAAIEMGVLSGWLAGGGSPVHSVALTDEGLVPLHRGFDGLGRSQDGQGLWRDE